MKRFLVLLVLAIGVAGIAHADNVSFATSNTLGCFSGSSCTPISSTAATTDLSFAGGNFGPLQSTGGNLSITLGSFTLYDSKTAWIDKDFSGLVTFTMPTVINGSAQAKFTAEVTGLVLKNALGLVYIDFNNSPLHFTFQNATYSPVPSTLPSAISSSVLSVQEQATP